MPSSAPVVAPAKRLSLWKRLALGFVGFLGLAYVSFCVYLQQNQNSLLYPRYDLSAAQAIAECRLVGLQPWPNAANLVGYVPADFYLPHPRGTIVLFHGNGAWSRDRMIYHTAFERRGFRVFFYEYPGYGGRPGRPSERAIVPDARAIIRQLARENLPPVYLWGESLGGGVVPAVAAVPTLPIRGIVLLTPWDTLTNVASDHYPFIPLSLIIEDHYDSIANLKNFRYPIAIVRSSADTVIAPARTLNLFAHLPEPKQMIVLSGYDHVNWPAAAKLSWWDQALDFIAPPAHPSSPVPANLPPAAANGPIPAPIFYRSMSFRTSPCSTPSSLRE